MAVTASEKARNQAYNVACNNHSSLNQLFYHLKAALKERGVKCRKEPISQEFRAGEERHSLASVDKIGLTLDYEVRHSVQCGIRAAVPWHIHKELAPQ